MVTLTGLFLQCTFGALVGLKEGRETKKKMLNSAKGLISQRRRVEKKNDISFSFYIVYFGDSFWREKNVYGEFRTER